MVPLQPDLNVGCQKNNLFGQNGVMTEGSHHSLQHGGVNRGSRVSAVRHELGQVTRAVQRVCVGPFLECLLAIKEHQLKSDWRFLGEQESHVRVETFSV